MTYPREWIKIELSTFVDLQNGFAFKSKTYQEGGDFVIRIGNVQDGYVSLNNPAYVDADELNAQRFRLQNNDLLLSLTGNVGRVARIKEDQLPAVLNQRVARALPSKFVYRQWVYYLLRSNNVQSEVQSAAKGAAQLNISTKDLLSILCEVPPYSEQKAIADKLDTSLVQVATIKSRLEGTLETLKQFRQSVLADAVSGKLTEDWRNSSLSEWQQVKLIDVVESKPRNGKSPKGVDYATSYRNLTLSAITTGKFIENKFKFVELDIDSYSHLWVKNGDILIQRANTIDYVGVSAIYGGEDDKYVYPDLIMKCRPNNDALGKFLHLTLLSDKVRKYFRDNATGTAGNMPKINQQVVSNAPVALPTIAEQQEIVNRVEKLFAGADATEQQVNQALARVNNLTQSILAKAFRGELTEQWRKDNPELISGENSAEALLDKIKAERAQIKPKRNTRKKA
ncbi:restriction endonuclease subunit S [uncultured Vibrio sp.]|uniref:restriction endonuclease subunit S n=1 Tax=uncultured Vibrio sp. TaxID=114054 RepID=UPI00260529E4|nr:restriction endonuclease subunit S [uncultured Vibrio sp.]